MNPVVVIKILESWADEKGKFSSTQEILHWIEQKNRDVYVHVEQCTLPECASWYLDPADHVIRNESGAFFSICGLKVEKKGKPLSANPVILQPEIGYLGLIVKEIKGVYHFLMQAKIEPGNVNKIQLSPTIQATRSNFTRVHQGNEPPYLDFFLRADCHTVLSDQLQSEQSARFYHKRNRNMIILVDGEVPCLPSHRWMTLGQIKALMRYDNLVNMDTRTVLSGLPVSRLTLPETERNRAELLFSSPAFAASVLKPAEPEGINKAWHMLCNIKMFDNKQRTLVGLNQLAGWEVTERGITPVAGQNADYEVIFCRIEIEGREVRRWAQPLIRARGEALFGLLISDFGGKRRFLCRVTEEAGCFDVAEWGPAIQRESGALNQAPRNAVEALFFGQLERGEGILCDVRLSEEGGRFYHEQNRNVLIYTDQHLTDKLPPKYLWLDYAQLSRLMEGPNALNIQLRNVLSLLPL